jgi:hypothetical protein
MTAIPWFTADPTIPYEILLPSAEEWQPDLSVSLATGLDSAGKDHYIEAIVAIVCCEDGGDRLQKGARRCECAKG